jgi:hypothetical protein
MSIANGQKRSIKTSQRATRLLAFRIEGSTGTPSIEGLDKHQVSVTDTDVGTYTITLNNAFANTEYHVVATVEGADKAATVTITNSSTFVVKVNDIDETAALSDDDVQVMVIGSDVTDRY